MTSPTVNMPTTTISFASAPHGGASHEQRFLGKHLFQELPIKAQKPLQLSRALAKYKTPLPGSVCTTDVYACSSGSKHGRHDSRTYRERFGKSAMCTETQTGLRMATLGPIDSGKCPISVPSCEVI